MSDVLDVFAERATPQARKTRPAVFAARMAWARQRLTAERAGAEPAITCVQGIGVGDKVQVELSPHIWWRGTVLGWERGGDTAALPHVTCACVQLDPWRGGLTVFAGHPSGAVVRRPRHKLDFIPLLGART